MDRKSNEDVHLQLHIEYLKSHFNICIHLYYAFPSYSILVSEVHLVTAEPVRRLKDRRTLSLIAAPNDLRNEQRL